MSGFDQLFGLDQSPGLGQDTLNEQPQQGIGGWSPQEQQNFGQNADTMSGLSDWLTQQAADEAKPQTKRKITLKADGTIGIDGLDMETAQQVYGGFQQHQKTQAAFNAEALRLKAQEDKIRANPLLAVLSAVAAGAAQDPRMPPIVRALGYANASLNPSADSLAQKRMGILQTLAQLESHGAAAAETKAYRETQIENTRADNARADAALKLKEGVDEQRVVKELSSSLADPAEVDDIPGLSDKARAQIKKEIKGKAELALKKAGRDLDTYRAKAGIRSDSKMAEIHARGAEARLTQKDLADHKHELAKEMTTYRLAARSADPTVRATTMGRLYGTSAYIDQAIQKYQFVLTNPMADDTQKALAKKMIDELAENKLGVDGLLGGIMQTQAPASGVAPPAAAPAPQVAPAGPAPAAPRNPNILGVRRVGGSPPAPTPTPGPSATATPRPSATSTPRPSTTNPPPPKKLGSVGSGSSWFASQLKAEDERLRRSKR